MAVRKSKERKSICEESMLLIVNLLKFSSLSLARTTSPSAGPPPPPNRLTRSYSSRRKALRAPEGGSKLSYVMLPTGGGEGSTVVIHQGKKSRGGKIDGDGRFADYIRRFHEKTENEVQNAMVECKASDYIKRFHEKNRKDSSNDSKRLPYHVLPPHLHLSHQNYS